MDETHAMTIRFPNDVYEWLRRQAFERRSSMNDMVVAAVTATRFQMEWTEQKKAERQGREA